MGIFWAHYGNKTIREYPGAPSRVLSYGLHPRRGAELVGDYTGLVLCVESSEGSGGISKAIGLNCIPFNGEQ